jgi:hypothetical protein
VTEATETKKTSLWKKWKNISEKVANFQGRVILEVLYFTIFLIPGVLVTLLSDRLRIKKPPKTWDEKEHKNIKDLSEAKEQ